MPHELCTAIIVFLRSTGHSRFESHHHQSPGMSVQPQEETSMDVNIYGIYEISRQASWILKLDLPPYVVKEVPCRYDVLLTANATPGNYWISAQSQYRMGTPSGFAVLTYQGTNASLPSTTPSQPGSVKPWTLSQINSVCCPPHHASGLRLLGLLVPSPQSTICRSMQACSEGDCVWAWLCLGHSHLLEANANMAACPAQAKPRA